jgi:hypothetical protein
MEIFPFSGMSGNPIAVESAEAKEEIVAREKTSELSQN